MKTRSVVAEISVVPLGTGKASVSDYVASCLDVVAASKKVKYCLTSMGTIVEGPLAEVLEITRKMHEVPFARGAARVITTLKIDDRVDKKLTMQGKLDAVKKIRPQVKL
jgi:uncharacterized protein (TIGR00106 family)